MLRGRSATLRSRSRAAIPRNAPAPLGSVRDAARHPVRTSVYSRNSVRSFEAGGLRHEGGTQVGGTDGVGILDHHLLAGVESRGGHPERKRQDEGQQTERGAHRRTDRGLPVRPADACLRLPNQRPSSTAANASTRVNAEESWYRYFGPMRSCSPPLTSSRLDLGRFCKRYARKFLARQPNFCRRMSSFDVSGEGSVVLLPDPAEQNMPRGSLSTQPSASQVALAERFCQTRALTTALIAPLAAEDCVVQSMPDASPAKWHLAHTTWFFEQFVLGPHAPAYREFDPRFGYLFNSYYETVGDRHRRAERGLLTRPTLEDVRAYRDYVDEGVLDLLGRGTSSRARDAHRSRPASRAAAPGTAPHRSEASLVLQSVAPTYRELEMSEPADLEPLLFYQCPEGIYEIGHSGSCVLFRQRDAAAPCLSRAIRSRASPDQQCRVS